MLPSLSGENSTHVLAHENRVGENAMSACGDFPS
jgi:hypothetical protein